MSDKDAMVYVAADPTQPGAAWAAFVDDPGYKADVKRDMAKEIAAWVRKGAQVQRVPVAQAREMLAKWVRPEKTPKRAAQQQGALFGA